MFAQSLNSPALKATMTHSPGTPRTLSIGSEMEFSSSPVILPQDPEDKEGVELLLSIANIVSKEIASSDHEIFDDENIDGFRAKNEVSFSKPSLVHELSPRSLTDSPSSFLKDDTISAWQRVRAVSIDHGCKSPRRSPDVMDIRASTNGKPLALPTLVTPLGTRLRTKRKPSLKILAHKGKKEHIKFPKLTVQQPPTNQNNNLPNIMSQHKRKALEQSSIKGKSMTVIHRKKFSWKNYPELEAFLVANREEYLRHSALNYTIQQKKYNNRLTERLLDLAAEHHYVFNEDEFSFVTVRDRIRCFYKSYVQSSKKRGIVLGYAARKAGILSPADLQKSARKEGMIVNPL